MTLSSLRCVFLLSPGDHGRDSRANLRENVWYICINVSEKGEGEWEKRHTKSHRERETWRQLMRGIVRRIFPSLTRVSGAAGEWEPAPVFLLNMGGIVNVWSRRLSLWSWSQAKKRRRKSQTKGVRVDDWTNSGQFLGGMRKKSLALTKNCGSDV